MNLKHHLIFIFMSFLIVLEFCFTSPAARAQITIDGTLVPARELSGPHYEISADFGKQAGSNLFHSFGQFNISTGESAMFTGPNSVDNIIARVTGGMASRIDGPLRSEIPGANMFLLNPRGVMFGPSASLDISGSFHVSTADYLRLGGDGRFDAVHTENTVLTTAQPSAFGFLGDEPAGISVEGVLEVPEGRALSATGGDINISGGVLAAQSGQVSIASAASAGEVALTDSGQDISSFEQHGEIFLSRGSSVDVSGNPVSGSASGEVHIRGGRFVVTDTGSSVVSITGDSNGGGIDIQASDEVIIRNSGEIFTATTGKGRCGDVTMEARYLGISDGGSVTTDAFGAGRGGDISMNIRETAVISGSDSFGSSGLYAIAEAGSRGDVGNIMVSAGDLSIADKGAIHIETGGTGHGGDVTLNADRLDVTGGGVVNSWSLAAGNGGDISVTARESVRISGFGTVLSEYGPLSNCSGFYSNSFGSGDAGGISVSTDVLSIADNGVISADNGMVADGSIIGGEGLGGDIILEVNRLEMDRGYVSSSAMGAETGSGGDVSITALESVSIAGSGRDDQGLYGEYYGVYSQAQDAGDGGTVTIRTEDLSLLRDGMINAQTYGRGRGGNVILDVSRLEVHQGGTLTTSTRGAGRAGDISITARESVSISGAGVKFKNSWIYTATHSGGAGGDISVSTPLLKLGKKGLIYADTLGDDTQDGNTLPDGRAGNIILNADRLELSEGGTVSAGSKSEGRGGDIELISEQAEMTDGSSITAQSSGSGEAGDIRITHNHEIRMEDSAMTTEAVNAGGGKIRINTEESLYLLNSEITTSVREGTGNGGDIRIGSTETKAGPQFIILNRSKIKANADFGDGGAVFLVTDNYFKSADSSVTAKSERGNHGTVKIESPDTDLSGDLIVVPGSYLDAARWLPTPCKHRSGKDVSRFLIRGRDGVPPPHDGVLASPLFPPDNPMSDGDEESETKN
ncbi:filamentous hemagglutinin N-terminal domain-containing protein [Desulfococcaceae bacterium HSG8]|nr:filamentous hemagglutinin N-terminal domain-containing protein [Desulfococcaceae bacterium HSG8]